MVDMVLLRYHMGRNNDNQSDLAKALGMSQSALSERMNGHIDFRKNEMNAIRERYDLSAEDVQAIFFTPTVS